MFELTLNKNELLTPLLTIAGAVDKKQSLPILSNILLKLIDNKLYLTATDLEIEITGSVVCSSSVEGGVITVSAKKMIDIVKSLDDAASVTLAFKSGTATIKMGRSQFKLTTLEADNYPCMQDEASEVEFSIPRGDLTYLLQATCFAMSQQDVRVFLNCLFLEFDSQSMTAVAMDGHRMAICRLPHQLENQEHFRLLLPRKGVQEILRLLQHVEEERVSVSASKKHIKIATDHYIFLSKLVDARFPSYAKAIPKNQDKQVLVDRDLLKRALSRIVILANERSRAVLLHIHDNQLTLIANNQEQEEATESLEAQTDGESLQIGINASYLLDILGHLQEGLIRLSFSNTESSILVESVNDERCQYIIMPMKI